MTLRPAAARAVAPTVASTLGPALVVAAVLLVGGWPVPAGASTGAHPGHGSLALVGTLVAATTDAVTLDVRDPGSAAVTRRHVGLDEDTRVRVGKEAIDLRSLAEWLGARVVAAVDYDEGPDGQTVYRATRIQITPPKPKRR